MQRYGLGVIVVWGTLLGMALAAEQRPSIPDETERVGQQYFVRYCSACHGVEGRGDGPAAPVLQPPPADLTRIAQRRGGHFPVAEIRAYIDGRTGVPAHGRREMPVWGERFGEIVGATRSARPWSRAISGSSSPTSNPSSDKGPLALHLAWGCCWTAVAFRYQPEG